MSSKRDVQRLPIHKNTSLHTYISLSKQRNFNIDEQPDPQYNIGEFLRES